METLLVIFVYLFLPFHATFFCSASRKCRSDRINVVKKYEIQYCEGFGNMIVITYNEKGQSQRSKIINFVEFLFRAFAHSPHNGVFSTNRAVLI